MIRPNHPLAVGTYFGQGRYGWYLDEYKDWTSVEYLWWRRGFALSDQKTEDWLPDFHKAAQKAIAAGLKLHLNLDGQDDQDFYTALRESRQYWDHVVTLEIADEPTWDHMETSRVFADLDRIEGQLGLKPKPRGITYTKQQVKDNAANGTLDYLDWVGVEAYVDPADQDLSQDELAHQITANLDKQAGWAKKPLVVVGQAYARNYAWTNAESLAWLQVPTYEWCAQNANVIALNWFSWGRPSGAREFPNVKRNLRAIGSAIVDAP